MIEFLMGDSDCDVYGRVIMMKNYIEYGIGKNPNIVRAMELTAHDDGFRRKDEERELPRHLAAIPAADRELYERLIQDADYRLELTKKIRPQLEDMIQEFALLNHIDGLKASVLLVHGAGDNVVHPRESEHIYEKLKELGVTARLNVTPLLSHGDTSLGFHVVKEALHLANDFRFFFKEASK